MEDIIDSEVSKEFALMAKKLGYSSVKSLKEVKSSPGNDKIRSLIERGAVKMIYDIELSKREDFIHHRNSGLNQVLCKLMADKKVEYAVNFRRVLYSKHAERSSLLGRIMQNVRLCKKYAVKTGLYSFARKPTEMRNPKDLKAFAKILGI